MLKEPLTLAAYSACTQDSDVGNFDVLPLLDFASAYDLLYEPLPVVHPNAAYLLHAPGHYLALVPTKLGYLLCDSLRPLPYVLIANDAGALLSVFHTMQLATGHVDMANPLRAAAWMGFCLWKRN